MKILHLIYDDIGNPWVGGGGAVRVRELYERLSSRHEITVMCGAYPGGKDHMAANVRYMLVGTGRNNYVLSTFCYAVQAARKLRACAAEYDVVVEDFAPYNPVFSFLRHKKAILQLHQREGLRHLKKYAFFGIPFFITERFYPRLFKNVFAELPSSRKKFRLRGKVYVLPNGFDPKLLELEGTEESYILFIGRFHINQKGLDILHEAMRFVHSRIIIVGGGKDEAAVKRLFDDSIRTGQSEFVGYAWGEKKEELMRKCLFLVAPSRYEGQPLILMDAAACGKPVIVSDIPELRYTIEAGFGMGFRTGDAKDLAEKINVLLNKRDLREEMGKKARDYARNFSWNKIAEEYEKYLLGISGDVQ